MKMNREDRLQVLTILQENLRVPQPQVVNVERIADRLRRGLKETRELLLYMDQAGEIKSDQEGEYALITATGVSCLESASGL